MDPKRRQQNDGNRKRGWDSETAGRDERAPYDPTKEKFLAEVGRVALDRHDRNQLVVEIYSYDGKEAPRIGVKKIGVSRQSGESYSSHSIGKLKPELAEQLARLLTRGCEMIRSGVSTKVEGGAFSVEPK